MVKPNRGCSSVVERHVANVNVEGSTPFTRFQKPHEAPEATCGFFVVAACYGWLFTGGMNSALTPKIIGGLPASWAPMSGAPLKPSEKLGITTPW